LGGRDNLVKFSPPLSTPFFFPPLLLNTQFLLFFPLPPTAFYKALRGEGEKKKWESDEVEREEKKKEGENGGRKHTTGLVVWFSNINRGGVFV